MQTASVATSSPSSDGSNPAHLKKQEDKAPPPPKIGKLERFMRILAVPISFLVGYHFFHTMSRDGVEKIYEQNGQLKDLQKKLADDIVTARQHPDPTRLRNRISEIIQDFDKGVTDKFKSDSFKNTLDFFKGNSHRDKLNIVLTTGAAISITAGLITTFMDPRNRSAVTGLFRKVDKQAQESQER